MALHQTPTQTAPTVVPGGQGIYELSAKQKARLGTPIQVGDREFVYCQFAATIAAGHLVQAAAAADSAWFQDLKMCTTYNTGTTRVKVLMTGGGDNSLSTADYMNDGYLYITTSAETNVPGGYFYRIKEQISTSATSRADSQEFELYDPIVSTVDTGEIAGIMRNVYKMVTSCVTNAGPAVGLTVVQVQSTSTCQTTAPYGWMQVKGPAVARVGSEVLNAYHRVGVSASDNGRVGGLDADHTCTTSTLTNAIATLVAVLNTTVAKQCVGVALQHEGGDDECMIILLDL